MGLVIGRPPQDDDELWWYIYAMWGVRVPRVAVCQGHTSPFNALADAYFGRSAVSMWYASRGFGGKSYLLATLALTEAVALGARVNVLGGSAAQSINVHEHTGQMWLHKTAPTDLLAGDPTQFRTRLRNGGNILALMASQKSVRGPHPQRLRLDEIDEMELEILEAAQGQPMDKNGIASQTVMCVAGFTMVTTKRGEVAVVDVTPDDEVMTRQGWRKVRAVTMSGYKQVVNLKLSNGRTLTCTDDHRIATPDGWVIPKDMSPGQEVCGIRTHLVSGQPGCDSAALSGHPASVVQPVADSLTGLADTATTLGVAGVVGRELVPLGAVGLDSVGGAGGVTTVNVGAVGHWVEMVGVDTGPVAAGVVQFASIRDGANETLPCPDVDRATVDGSVQHPVSTGLGSVPHPAPVLVDGRPLQEPVTVVDITTWSPHLYFPVYDIAVDDVHEFTAEHIVVHNSSTWQNPAGTMTEMMRRANENGWPVYTWCFRETGHDYPNNGWLSPEQIIRKQSEVSKQMWTIEYDLQEPSHQGRAIDPEFVDEMFDPDLGVWDGDIDQRITVEEPDPGATYITGVDWAKERDFTVITTFRTDCNPWRMVAFMRTARKPWPQMITDVEMRLERYGGLLVHDATGIGDVIDDMIEYDRRQVLDVVLRGRDRETCFTEYIAGIEQRALKCPRIRFPYEEHKYVTQKDLFTTSGHPPDSFIAGALCWKYRNRGRNFMVAPGQLGKAEDTRWVDTPVKHSLGLEIRG